MPAPATSTKRNLEKELVLSCNVSWKVAKSLTDAVRENATGSDDDAILEAARNLYQSNPETYNAMMAVKRPSDSPKGAAASATFKKQDSTEVLNDEDDDIINEIVV